MKKQLILVLSVLFSIQLSAQNDDSVIEIDGKKVSKSEFLQIYLKNNNAPKYDQQSLDEYMELFKKFKLKVAEAEALGYDTIPKLKKELEGYRKQLAQPYLIDSSQNSYLVNQAYERMKTEIRASHILIRVEENALPEDTLRAYNKIMALKKRIEAGEDFAAVAKSKGGSEDPSAQRNNGDLGFFTAFQMVYQFEEAAYTTPVGSISNPVRTKYGYHILKIADQRPARGTMKAAHIMIAVAKDAPEEEKLSAQKKVDEIYAKLKNGESFATLASEFSDDGQTAEKGGELPLFGTGTTTRMVPEFEEAAFALKNDNDISQPVKTDVGFHIIKRLQWTPLRTFAELKKEIQSKVNKDDRAISTQLSFITKMKKTYGFADNFAKTSKWFVQNIDTNYVKGKWNASKLKSDKVMFTLADQKFTQKQFAKYLEKNYRAVRSTDNRTLVEKQYANFQKAEILAYEERQLDNKYPEFKALMKEYHDGILLYEVMTDKVWNKAIKDTAGLRVYFNANNSKYVWGERANAYVYECSSKEVAAKVATLLKSDTISSKTIIGIINKDSELNLRVRTGKFETATTSYLKNQVIKKGVNPVYQFENKFYVVKVDELLPAGPKLLSEAKGAATSDYQTYLEKQWLEEIAKKHPIIVNKQVLYSLGN
ncbi:MAG: peptidylprolyl isomerase [Moraxellaceae bacterium]